MERQETRSSVAFERVKLAAVPLLDRGTDRCTMDSLWRRTASAALRGRLHSIRRQELKDDWIAIRSICWHVLVSGKPEADQLHRATSAGDFRESFLLCGEPTEYMQLNFCYTDPYNPE